jgi:glucose/arabinose dehydrogenase
MLHLTATLLVVIPALVSACSRHVPPRKDARSEIVAAEGRGQETAARVGPVQGGAPVETAPPNVPEFKPAFPGQTRAPAIQTPTPFEVTELAGGFDQPWALAFLPDGRMLVTEKHDGQLFVLSPDGKQKSPPVEGVPRVDGRGQGGLLDVEVGPDYATSGLVYLTYYEPRQRGNGLAVARGRLSGDKPRLEGPKVIFRMEPTLDSTMHAGGRLLFTPDGKLFVTLGERSILPGRVQARDLGSHFGKIVRVNPDGSVPPDNPFVGRKGARPEIWTLGHRNILAADLDDRGRLWVVDMGPRGGDELNLVQRGKDYGWPTIGYGEEYSGERIHESTQAPGLEQPVYYWDPVISPGALTIYSGKLFPKWKGNFLIAGLSSQALVRLAVEDDHVVGEERLLVERGERVREVVEGPDGALYLLTDGAGGKLLKVTPRAHE